MRDTARKTAWNTALLVVSEIANPLLSLVLIGSLSRKLGAEGLGTYNLALSFFFVVHAFTALGLNPLVTRDVSRDRQQAGKYLSTATALGIPASLLAAGGLIILIFLGGYGSDVVVSGWLIGGSLIPSIIILYCEAIFIAHQRVDVIVALAIVENVCKVVVGLWLLYAGFGVVALVASFAVFRLMTLILNLLAFHLMISPLAWNYDGDLARALLRHVPVFGGILVLATLRMRVDVFCLSKMASLAAVGYYTAGFRLYEIAAVIPKSYFTSAYPVFSRLFHVSPHRLKSANSLSIRYLLIILLPLAAGIWGLADPVVRLLFGEEFGPAAPALKVVIWTLIPYGVGRVLVSQIFATNRQIIDLRINLIALVVNILLNCALIPRYGFIGCAWAALLSTVVFVGCQLYFLRKEVSGVLLDGEILKAGLAASGIAVWLFVTPGLILPVRIGGGIVVYGILLLGLRVIRLRELAMFLPDKLAAKFLE